MSESDKPQIEDLADELAFWNAFREARRANGVDIARYYAEWAAEIEHGLASPGPRDEFAELCRAGCHSQVLAALVLMIQRSPLLEKFWTEMVGQPKNRERATRALENAAQTVEMLYSDVIALGEDAENEQFAKLGRIPISRLASELRFHIRFINFAQTIKLDTETHSPEKLTRYLLSGYVKRMTGDFHDRCVSGLVGGAVDSDRYGEEAHRMWRNRNYKRLEKHYSWMVKILVAMSVVLEHTT